MRQQASLPAGRHALAGLHGFTTPKIDMAYHSCHIDRVGHLPQNSCLTTKHQTAAQGFMTLSTAVPKPMASSSQSFARYSAVPSGSV